MHLYHRIIILPSNSNVLPGSTGKSGTRHGNLSIQSISKLAELINTAMKNMGREEYQALQTIYEPSVLRAAQKILVVLPEWELLSLSRRHKPECGQPPLPEPVITQH